MTSSLPSLKHSALLFIAAIFSISTAAAAAPPGNVNPGGPGEEVPEQIQGNLSNKTGGNPLSMVPGLENETLPSMPKLPEQASDVAKTVTSTVGEAFSSAVDGIGSFLSANLPVIRGSDTPERPVNGTNSTR